MEIRIAFTEIEFRRLVAGKEVEHTDESGAVVKIILNDIGWTRMFAAINDAVRPSLRTGDK